VAFACRIRGRRQWRTRSLSQLPEAEHEALQDLLGAYALGAVSRDEAETIEAHLQGCAECGDEVAELAVIVRRLGRRPPRRLR
jgi:anti-sigma factor RsiW